MTFYLVTGVLLSSITWSALSHSAVTGDYALSVILLGMTFHVTGKFFVDRPSSMSGMRSGSIANLTPSHRNATLITLAVAPWFC